MTIKVPGSRPAVVTIDLHRGHLDPAIATMPLASEDAARVVESTRRFLNGVHEAGVAVSHVVTRYRDPSEALSNPFWATLADTDASRSSVRRHQVEPTAGNELMPGLYDPRQPSRRPATLQRWSCPTASIDGWSRAARSGADAGAPCIRVGVGQQRGADSGRPLTHNGPPQKGRAVCGPSAVTRRRSRPPRTAAGTAQRFPPVIHPSRSPSPLR